MAVVPDTFHAPSGNDFAGMAGWITGESASMMLCVGAVLLLGMSLSVIFGRRPSRKVNSGVVAPQNRA
ncbi:hypothetical protein [Mycetocola tolaasinivorans]|nr:hypothetical protein [Mycetocola tolaasinivorans]